eukprot:gene12836-biopygen8616
MPWPTLWKFKEDDDGERHEAKHPFTKIMLEATGVVSFEDLHAVADAKGTGLKEFPVCLPPVSVFVVRNVTFYEDDCSLKLDLCCRESLLESEPELRRWRSKVLQEAEEAERLLDFSNASPTNDPESKGAIMDLLVQELRERDYDEADLAKKTEQQMLRNDQARIRGHESVDFTGAQENMRVLVIASGHTISTPGSDPEVEDGKCYVGKVKTKHVSGDDRSILVQVKHHGKDFEGQGRNHIIKWSAKNWNNHAKAIQEVGGDPKANEEVDPALRKANANCGFKLIVGSHEMAAKATHILQRSHLTCVML